MKKDKIERKIEEYISKVEVSLLEAMCAIRFCPHLVHT